MSAIDASTLGAPRDDARLVVGANSELMADTSVPGRTWTTNDIVGVSRITSVAVSDERPSAMYVLKTPSASPEKSFGLFFVDWLSGDGPTKLLEARYIADVAKRPNAEDWSILADFGQGIQLYLISKYGRATKLVRIESPPLVGGSDGLQVTVDDKPRPTGVLSYGWSPDGGRLWYSTLKIRTDEEQRAIAANGIIFNDAVMWGATPRDFSRAAKLVGTQLRLLEIKGRKDEAIALESSDIFDLDTFRSQSGGVTWIDNDSLQYRIRNTRAGDYRIELYRISLSNRKTQRIMPNLDANSAYYSSATPTGIIYVRRRGGADELVEIDCRGSTSIIGAVGFDRINSGQVWTMAGGGLILSARQRDRDTLVSFPASLTDFLSRQTGHLNICAVAPRQRYAICSRERMDLAPELVRIEFDTKSVTPVATPNQSYAVIAPLRVEERSWTSRYGQENSGYVVYPRHYEKGQRYPGILVSHSRDARNTYADQGLQWDYPVQVFAERGFFVILANEPLLRRDDVSAEEAVSSKAHMDKLQFREAYGPLAALEAAAADLIESGDLDPARVGIAGYSRGSTMVRFALSHSSVFSAGSSGDATWWDVGGFWDGSRSSQSLYTSLLGGSPFESEESFNRYRAFSPSARADKFAGPLLQQFSSATAWTAVEMNQQLRYVGVPTELVVFPGESHLFSDPQHRLAAMAQNIDWFEFWLNGIEDRDPAKTDQYTRWRQLRSTWKKLVEKN